MIQNELSKDVEASFYLSFFEFISLTVVKESLPSSSLNVLAGLFELLSH